jgi:hypothetical protein
MAELQKTPLEQLIDWISSWKASFDQLRERIGWPLTVLIVLAAAGGFLWWKCDEIAKRPGVKWLIERLKRRKIKRARAELLTIAVAHLDNHKDREHEKLLLHELRHSEGVEAVSVDRAVDPEQPDKKLAEKMRAACFSKPAPMF